MIEKQNVNIAFLTTIGAVSTVLLIVVSFGLQAWVYSEMQGEKREKVAGEVNWQLEDMRLEQLQRINTYRWVDEDKRIAAIPIDRAIELTAKRIVPQERDGQQRDAPPPPTTTESP